MHLEVQVGHDVEPHRRAPRFRRVTTGFVGRKTGRVPARRARISVSILDLSKRVAFPSPTAPGRQFDAAEADAKAARSP